MSPENDGSPGNAVSLEAVAGPAASAADEVLSPADRALAEFAARRRAAWRRYLAALAVVAVLLASGIWFVWRHSEIRAVSSRTTTIKPSPLPQGPLPATLSAAWSSPDRVAAGDAVVDDVLVTYSAHTVNGRDISTGAVRWSYSRSNRTICTVNVQDSTAVAIYSNRGLCDEVTGLTVSTGQRAFVRTLTLNATAGSLRVQGRPGYLAIIAPNGIELISPGDHNVPGVDFWLDEQASGCSTVDAVLGSAGVLIASHCDNGDTLSLHDLSNKTARVWSVPLTGRVPLAASQEVVALSQGGRSIEYLGATKGTVIATSPLDQQVSGPSVGGSTDLAGSTDYLVAVSGGYLAVRNTKLLHQGSAAATPAVSASALLLAGADQVDTVSYSTGAVTDHRSAAGITAATRLVPAGSYLVAANASGGVTVYR